MTAGEQLRSDSQPCPPTCPEVATNLFATGRYAHATVALNELDKFYTDGTARPRAQVERNAIEYVYLPIEHRTPARLVARGGDHETRGASTPTPSGGPPVETPACGWTSSSILTVSPRSPAPSLQNDPDREAARAPGPKAGAPTRPDGAERCLPNVRCDRRAARRPRRDPRFPGSAGRLFRPPGHHPSNGAFGGRRQGKRLRRRSAPPLLIGSTRRRRRLRRRCRPFPTTLFAVRRPPEGSPLTSARPGRLPSLFPRRH